MSTALQEALSLGAAAFLVGLSGAMAPGPYLTVTITRTLRQGRLSAFLMLVGHAALEGALLIGFAFGLQRFLTKPTVAAVLAVLGGIVLLWMGFGLFRGAYTGSIRLETDADAGAALPRFGPVLHGAVMSLSSPYWTLWWATIGVKLAADGLAIGPIGVAAFFIGHQLADLVWYSAVIGAVSAGKRVLSDRVYRIVIGACAIFLLYLGARFALEPLL
ncbi:MAG: LysE family transporter [Actinomycetota bacterium]|nr:MAG: lysine exporter protein [Actinomycetota bacterium]MDO8949057.1 LysE family transporter [Actinomycetota bacterium]MDP3630600.1 LysE family transporter [Actinomycetota bacterium]